MIACVTVDVEQDCPSRLSTWRGIVEALPRLLDLLDDNGVTATCFTTGETARRFPDAVSRLVERGHELACHGDTHRPFDQMSRQEADAELRASTTILRQWSAITAFRAPFLRFPTTYLDLLPSHGLSIDSSQGRHKHFRVSVHTDGGVLRVPASITSSTLRWVPALRDPLLRRLTEPAVLFVHPWEFVDLRRERLRFDCRWGTGEAAFHSLASAINVLRQREATFMTLGAYSRWLTARATSPCEY